MLIGGSWSLLSYMRLYVPLLFYQVKKNPCTVFNHGIPIVNLNTKCLAAYDVIDHYYYYYDIMLPQYPSYFISHIHYV